MCCKKLFSNDQVTDAGDDATTTEALRLRKEKVMAALNLPEHSVRYKIRGAHVSMLNALRRTIVADLRSLAVDVAVVHANTSCMYDEMLVHRIAHVPLSCPPEFLADDNYKVTIHFKVNVPPLKRGAINGFHLAQDIMSNHLVCDHPAIRVKQDIRILRLLPGQRVCVVAAARPGTGREHTKWKCAYTATLKNSRGCESEHELFIETNSQKTCTQAIQESANELVCRLDLLHAALSNAAKELLTSQ